MLDWLFKKSNYYRFQDSYGFNKPAVVDAIKKAVTARMEVQDTILLLVHFPGSLDQTETMLDELDLPFVIGTSRIDEAEITNLRQDYPGHVILSMAGMLKRSDQKPLRQPSPNVAVMIAERHPMPKYDQAIEDWAKWLPFPVQLGYFLSLEDPVINYTINDQVKQLLSQFGMGENELVTSNLVSRRVRTVLKRLARDLGKEIPCESPEKWLEANYPEPEN